MPSADQCSPLTVRLYLSRSVHIRDTVCKPRASRRQLRLMEEVIGKHARASKHHSGLRKARLRACAAICSAEHHADNSSYSHIDYRIPNIWRGYYLVKGLAMGIWANLGRRCHLPYTITCDWAPVFLSSKAGAQCKCLPAKPFNLSFHPPCA